MSTRAAKGNQQAVARGEWFGRRPSVRMLEAAEKHNWNAAHWRLASDAPVNHLLAWYLPEVRRRAMYEARENDMVEGVINTYTSDLFGESGPALQVTPAGDDYARTLERIWRAWVERCDVTAHTNLWGIAALECRHWFTCGESLTQMVGDPEADPDDDLPVALRLQSIEPRRLGTPLAKISDPAYVLGVERTAYGRPLRYWISDDRAAGNVLGAALTIGLNYVPVDAAAMVHQFSRIEAGQARCVPWLTSALPGIADLRDYDAEVMTAARSAALQGVLLQNVNTPDVASVNESAPIERGMMTTLPPGYTATMVAATQPMANYPDYRSERLRGLGRPLGMPLMMVTLDSSGHNYSSARFDSQLYQRLINRMRRFYERTLNRYLLLVEREAQLAGALGRRPAALQVRWGWPKFPHVDPKKEADAAYTRILAGVTSQRIECEALGYDVDEVRRQREEEGLPAGPVLDPRTVQEALLGQTPETEASNADA